MSNTLPINKIVLVSFAFAFTYWKKILWVSIIPIIFATPFLLIYPDLLLFIRQVLEVEKVDYAQLPDNLFVYFLLFFYAYIVLSINVYRLIILGENSINRFTLVIDFKKIIRFLGLIFFIAIVSELPFIITGQKIIYLIVYFLVVPITLNFINIAIDKPLKYRWNLNLSTHFNLFFLQAIFPMLVTIMFVFIDNFIGLNSILEWVIKIILFYWTLISLAMCYKFIVFDNSN